MISQKRNAVLITGAVGLVGQYVLRKLIEKRYDLALMVRPRGRTSSAQRIDRLISRWEREIGATLPRPKIIEWDIRTDSSEIHSSDRQWLKSDVASIVHCAASVQFVENATTGEPTGSNVQGTQSLLNLAKELDGVDFHHVSTAYVCGDRHGSVMESELDKGQKFLNVYEKSKFIAERLVYDAAPHLASTTTYRPSIVLGDSRTGFSPTFNTLYAGLRFARALDDSCVRDVGALLTTLGLSGKETKNLVPVDWIADAITSIMNLPNRLGQTYHLTHPYPVSLLAICTAMTDAIRLEPETWSRMGAMGPRLKDIDVAADSFLSPFKSYFRPDPMFERTNTATALPLLEVPRMENELLVRLFRYAISKMFREQEFDRSGIIAERNPSSEHGTFHPHANREIDKRPTWQLQIAGSEQPFQSFPFNDPIEPMLAQESESVVRMHSDTWNALEQQKVTLQQAMRCGAVALIAPTYRHAELLAWLERRLSDGANEMGAMSFSDRSPNGRRYAGQADQKRGAH